MSELPLGTQVPNESCDAENNGAEDGSVGLPVGRLGIPTTGRRPDVLGVAVFRGIARLGVGSAMHRLGDSRDSGTAALQQHLMSVTLNFV